MIRTIKVLVCDEEHGIGDQTFPRLSDLEPNDFVNGVLTTPALRKRAKAAGWTFSGGHDWCDQCSAGVNDELNHDQ